MFYYVMLESQPTAPNPHTEESENSASFAQASSSPATPESGVPDPFPMSYVFSVPVAPYLVHVVRVPISWRTRPGCGFVPLIWTCRG